MDKGAAASGAPSLGQGTEPPQVGNGDRLCAGQSGWHTPDTQERPEPPSKGQRERSPLTVQGLPLRGRRLDAPSCRALNFYSTKSHTPGFA